MADVIAYSLTIILCVVGSVVAVRNRRGEFVAILFVRLALILFHNHVLALPDSTDDAVRYHQTAIRLSQVGLFEGFTTGANLYPWIGSIFYRVFGPSVVFLQLINLLFSVAAIIVAGRLATVLRTSLGANPAREFERFVVLIAGFYPSTLLYSVIPMREAPIYLFVMLTLFYVLRATSGHSLVNLSVAVLWALGATALHTGFVALLSATVLLAAFVLILKMIRSTRAGAFRLQSAFGALGLTIGVSAALIAVAGGTGLEKLNVLDAGSVTESAVMYQDYAARGRLAYLDGLNADDTWDVALQLPLRLIHFIGVPHIMRMEPTDFLMVGEALVFAILFVVAVCGAPHRPRSLPHLLLAAIVLIGVCVFAIGVSNYGTAFRHRSKFAFALIAIVLPMFSTGVLIPTKRNSFDGLSKE